MAFMLKHQTVTELYRLNGPPNTIEIKLSNGRSLYATDFAESDRSLLIDRSSFTPRELGVLKRRVRSELFDKDDDADTVSEFFGTSTLIWLVGALTDYSGPIHRKDDRRLCIDHNRPVSGQFIIETPLGAMLPPVSIGALQESILSVALVKSKD